MQAAMSHGRDVVFAYLRDLEVEDLFGGPGTNESRLIRRNERGREPREAHSKRLWTLQASSPIPHTTAYFFGVGGSLGFSLGTFDLQSNRNL
jgi:hypothetical protein